MLFRSEKTKDVKETWNAVKNSRKELRKLDSEWVKLGIAESSTFTKNHIQSLKNRNTEISTGRQPFGFIIASNPGLMTTKNPNSYLSPAASTTNALEATSNHVKSMNQIKELGSDFQNTKGVIINGDLTAYGHPWQWDLYHKYYYNRKNSSEGALSLAVFPGLGNRDYENNLGDCWGPWYSIFDSKANWCAKNSLKVLEKDLEGLPINDFDVNTGSYSMTYGPVHIVQMHNHPFYSRPELKFHPSGQTQSALSWLQNNLKERSDKKIILNFHTPITELETDYSKEEYSQFLSLISQYNILGIFNGGSETRSSIGRNKPISSREGMIYSYYSGSANKNQFLYVHFDLDKMAVYSIDSASGSPRIINTEYQASNIPL